MVRTQKMARAALLTLLAKRIAMYEGFFNEGPKPTLARRNHNPGNLRSWGKTPIVSGFAKFETVDAGWKALIEQCSKNVFTRGLTFREFFCGKKGGYPGYAPDSDGNDCKRYAEFVAEFFGASIDRKIKDLVE